MADLNRRCEMTWILDQLEILAGKATPGPWEKDPWYRNKDDRNECGISAPHFYGSRVAVFRAPNFTSQSDWNNDADFVTACSPSVILAPVRVAKAADAHVTATENEDASACLESWAQLIEARNALGALK